MDAFATFREIWREASRRRELIASVAGVALLIGLFVAYRPGIPPESRQYQVWIASTDILVDTSDTQVVDAKGPDPLTLASRASLLGNVVATGSLRTTIATAAGVPADRLVVVPPAAPTDGVPVTPMPVTAPGSPIDDKDATVLKLSTDQTLPILHVSAQAPDASTAGRLAGATLKKLEGHLDSVSAREQGSAAHKLVVRQLAVRPPAAETRGTSRLLGLGAAIMLALLGCAAVVAVPMIARRWRQAEGAGQPNEPASREHDPTSLFGRAAMRSTREEDAELPRAAVVAGPGAISEGAEQPVQPKKQPRRRRKHGRPR